MSVTSEYETTQTHTQSRQGHSVFSNQQETLDWSKVTPLHWQQNIAQLTQSSIGPQDRLYWMLTLRDWLKFNLQTYTDHLGTAVVQYNNLQWDNNTIASNLQLMAEVAYKLCDWGLIIQLHGFMAQLACVTTSSDTIDPLVRAEQDLVQSLQLAVAYWQMGQLDEAEVYLKGKNNDLDAESPLADFHQHIVHDMQRRTFDRADCTDGELLLMPLEEQHLSGFSWVYHDPQIAKLCNLPDFDTDEQWFNWLDGDQINPNKQVFAIIHRQWGFIGSVGIEIHNGTGFIYYWLGQDFQGGGLGPESVLLLLSLASKIMGMSCCYAKVFEHNFASQKAMNKMGFTALPFKVAAPNENQIYFYRGPQKSEREQGEELVWLASITDVDNEVLIG
jgi:RimJ/RimL family protein N-acetyltransferase